MDQNCDLRIGDYGLARVAGDGQSALTEYVVTRWSRAPEIMLSAGYSKAADIWSAGCVLAEVLKRRPLFAGCDYLDQLRLIIGVLGTPPAAAQGHIKSERAKSFLAKQAPCARVPLSKILPKAPPDCLDLLEVRRGAGGAPTAPPPPPGVRSVQ